MKLVINDKDISNIYKSIEWSGDKNQRSRSISTSYVYEDGEASDQVNATVGDTVGLYDDGGKMRFVGIITAAEGSSASQNINFTARDILWYLGKNKVAKVYKGTADAITKAVCADFNITVGSIPVMDKELTIISTGDKTIYQVISEAYGDGYYIYADVASVCVAQAGSELVAVISGSGNRIQATYKLSIENMVNRVLILDEKGNSIGNVQNDADMIYGLLQDVYKQEKDKDPVTEAKKVLQATEKTVSVECLGNWDCVSGKAVYMMDTDNGAVGKYTILSDSHTFEDGYHKMSLELELEET
jgi:hypothetical protein